MSIQRINTARGHWYKIDGKKADGVTTLISDGLPKPGLMYWAANEVAGFVADNPEQVRESFDWMDRGQLYEMLRKTPWSKRDKAAAKGTEVHTLAEKLVHGLEVDVPEHLTGYVDSCVRFLDDWQVRPVLVETTVANRKYNYCGTLDLVADLAADGRRVIADYKTSKSGIYPETALQQAAYAFAEVYLDGDEEKPVADLGITGAFGVWIRPDGYDVYDLPCTEREFNAFLYIRAVALWAKQSKGLCGDPLTLSVEGAA